MGFIKAIGVLVATASAATSLAGEAQPGRLHDLAVRGCHVVDVAGGTIARDRTLVIADGRIVAVAPAAARVPPAARSVPCEGRYAIPGLWDMHVHLTDATMLDAFLAYGVLGVRDTAANLYAPAAEVRRWAEESAAGTRLAPRIVRASPILDSGRAFWPGTVLVESEADGRAAVRAAVADGADVIKIYSNLAAEALRGVVAEARAHRVPVTGHVPTALGLERAVSDGLGGVEHLIGLPLALSREREVLRDEARRVRQFADPVERAAAQRALNARVLDTEDDARRAELFAAFRRHGTWFVPTLRGWQFDLEGPPRATPEGPGFALVPPARRQEWRDAWAAAARVPPEQRSLARRQYAQYGRLTRALVAAGVGVLAGTDTPHTDVAPGLALHEELAAMVAAGVPVRDALATATVQPARYLRRADLGCLAAGCAADVVLVDANPLERIEHARQVYGVLRGGRWIDAAALRTLRAGVVDAYAAAATTERVAE